MSDNEKENKPKSKITEKTSSFGKKVVGGIQKGVKSLSEKTQKARQDQKMKKYNPLFPETFNSADFFIPNVIEIVDDAVRRGIDVCEGAIGWTDKVGGVEVLHLYDEFIQASKINFVPFARCDAVYCVDPFDKGSFINAETTFERTMNEKLAELEHIAYCLGAKSCSVEIVETKSQGVDGGMKVEAKKAGAVSGELGTSNKNMQSMKAVTAFSGNEKAKKPKLKWFAFDDSIKGLIGMRQTGKNLIKSKVLELSCASSATMSMKSACAVDKLNGTLSAECKARQEQSRKLIFEIEF